LVASSLVRFSVTVVEDGMDFDASGDFVMVRLAIGFGPSIPFVSATSVWTLWGISVTNIEPMRDGAKQSIAGWFCHALSRSKMLATLLDSAKLQFETQVHTTLQIDHTGSTAWQHNLINLYREQSAA
jgi:hypothetical protein